MSLKLCLTPGGLCTVNDSATTPQWAGINGGEQPSTLTRPA